MLEQRFRVLYQSFIFICLGNEAMCESGCNFGGAAHLIGNHQPVVTPKKHQTAHQLNHQPAAKPKKCLPNTASSAALLDRIQPSQKKPS
jgi:hypothetical protein